MGVAIADANARASFRRGQPNDVVLAQTATTKVVLECFEAGQYIPDHRPSTELALVVLEGEGTALVGAEEVHLRRGSVCFVPSEETRGFFAKTRMVVVYVVTTPGGAFARHGSPEPVAKPA